MFRSRGQRSSSQFLGNTGNAELFLRRSLNFMFYAKDNPWLRDYPLSPIILLSSSKVVSPLRIFIGFSFSHQHKTLNPCLCKL